MAVGSETAIDRMRQQAERAIASSKSRNTILPLLERLVRAAPSGSEANRFAHRQLAELQVEQHPWRALGHLKQFLQAERAQSGGECDDDGAYALFGLAHALLGNYRSAIDAYGRAVALAPRNPWYQHNLGHLLDVGIDRPKLALPHLEMAHRTAGPDDGEISASLAHCMARVGNLEAALEHADVAVATSPDNPEHVRLRSWILGGAKEPIGEHELATSEPASSADAPPARRKRKRGKLEAPVLEAPGLEAPVLEAPVLEAPVLGVPTVSEQPSSFGLRKTPARGPRSMALIGVEHRLQEHLAAMGHDETEIAFAVRLWDDFGARVGALRVRRVGWVFWVALIEFAVLHRRDGRASMQEVAERHGTDLPMLESRWRELEPRVQALVQALRRARS
jgi:hypothetical protein